MSTSITIEPPHSSDRKHTIVDDFLYGNNVAGASVYIRMGRYNFIATEFGVTNEFSGFSVFNGVH